MKKVKPAFSGFFITLEGGEGAGKTTLITHLENFLISHGITVLKTREPGGTSLGDHIRKWVLDHNDTLKIAPLSELLLFLAGRRQHIEDVILPALKAGSVVICDRFNDSSVAYQGAGRGLGESFVRELCDKISGEAIPNLTFYLDVDPSLGLQRTRKTVKENAAEGSVDRIESEDVHFHEKIRQAFIGFAKDDPTRIKLIDASQPLDTVAAIALAILKEKLTV